MQVEQLRTAGVRHVRGVPGATGQLPQQPAVDGADSQLSCLGALTRLGYMIEEPGDLRGTEVRIEDQAGSLLHHRFVTVGA